MPAPACVPGQFTLWMTPPPMPGSRYLPAVLLLLTVAAFATKNLAHYPFALLAILGLADCVRRPRETLASDEARLLIAVFACVWLPMLLSLVDAANPGRALKSTLLYLHYLPAGLYATRVLRDAALRRVVVAGVAIIVACWMFDGLVQLVRGRDVFGYPYDGGILTGMFHPKQRFGLVVAVFAPLYLHFVHGLARRRPLAWLLLLPLVIVILFSLKRSAWIMFIAAVGAYVACFVTWDRRSVRNAFVIAACVAIAFAGTLALKPNLRSHLAGTLEVFSADFAAADRATSYRLSLWRTGAGIVRDHWFNGVGPRGYRVVYRDYAPPDDFWIAHGSSGQTHPHLMALEVATETGIVGLAGYAFAFALLAVAAWRSRVRDPAATACLLVVLVAWLPLNTHLAFYGSYWSTLAWTVLAFACARWPCAGFRAIRRNARV